MVIRRRLLIELLQKADEEDRYDFVKDILIRYKNIKRIYGYKLDTYWSNISTAEAYFKTNMDFLKKDVRDFFFKQYSDIYSKVETWHLPNTTRDQALRTVLLPADALSTVMLRIR